jgi:hypothetical protein
MMYLPVGTYTSATSGALVVASLLHPVSASKDTAAIEIILIGKFFFMRTPVNRLDMNYIPSHQISDQDD